MLILVAQNALLFLNEQYIAEPQAKYMYSLKINIYAISNNNINKNTQENFLLLRILTDVYYAA